jgi:hypothetical protein
VSQLNHQTQAYINKNRKAKNLTKKSPHHFDTGKNWARGILAFFAFSRALPARW